MAQYPCPDPAHCTARMHNSAANCRVNQRRRGGQGMAGLFDAAPEYEGEIAPDHLKAHFIDVAAGAGSTVRTMLEEADDLDTATSPQANFMREQLRVEEFGIGDTMTLNALDGGDFYLNSSHMRPNLGEPARERMQAFGETAMDYLENSDPDSMVTPKTDNYNADDAVTAMMENGWEDSYERKLAVRGIAAVVHSEDTLAASALLEGLYHNEAELSLDSYLESEDLARDYPEITDQAKALCEHVGLDYDTEGDNVAIALRGGDGGSISFNWVPGDKKDVVDMMQASRNYGKANVHGTVAQGKLMIGDTPVYLEGIAHPKIHHNFSVVQPRSLLVPPSPSIPHAWVEDEAARLF